MMMTNLFSIFDPSLSMLSVFSLTLILIVFFIPMFFWGSSNLISVSMNNVFLFVKGELDFSSAKSVKGLLSVLASLFIVVFFMNFLSLFPFIFCLTSHLMVSLPLSYSVWLGVILFSWWSSLSNFLSHLVPVGTPSLLMSFMVLVELVSNLIRPLALTFRLTANMMAGHLLLSLVGGFLVSCGPFLLMSGSLIQSLLVSMELGVSLIQAYVFSTLILLYISESKY